jgi:phosphodiesterase/alkaline phosphatase D-like protein
MLSLLALGGLMGFVPAARAQAPWNSVPLSWTTPGDDSLTGTASQFDLRYSTALITATNFGSATRATGLPAPAAPGTHQSFTVTGLAPNTIYYFAIKTADEVPNWSGLSNVVSRTTTAAPDTIRPAPIANLAVTGVTDSTAMLGWTAVGDDSLSGTATSYDIRYSTAPINPTNWASAAQVTGEPAPAAPGTAQSFQVRGLSRQVTYYFAIRASDDAGNVSALSNVPSATTPDTLPPAAIRDLTLGLLLFDWIPPAALTPRADRSLRS